jgi:Ca-activated chloride channel family protein
VSGAEVLAHVQLELPWVLLLLPAPLLVWLLLPAYRERQESVRIPFFEEATAATGRKPSSGAVVLRLNWLQRIVAPLVWVLIVLAVYRPEPAPSVCGRVGSRLSSRPRALDV